MNHQVFPPVAMCGHRKHTLQELGLLLYASSLLRELQGQAYFQSAASPCNASTVLKCICSLLLQHRYLLCPAQVSKHSKEYCSTLKAALQKTEENRTNKGVAWLGAAYLQSVLERPLQVPLNLLVLNSLQTWCRPEANLTPHYHRR